MISIYTDASRRGDDVGAGWAICEGDYITAEGSTPLKQMNIHAAELLAIVEALEWIKANLHRAHVLKIYINSTFAVTVYF